MHVLMSISFTVGPDSSKKNILIGERLMKAELRRVILHEIQRERILDRFHYDFIAKLQYSRSPLIFINDDLIILIF